MKPGTHEGAIYGNVNEEKACLMKPGTNKEKFMEI